MPGFYPRITTPEGWMFSTERPGFSNNFVTRLKKAYRGVFARSAASGSSMWVAIGKNNENVHNALISDDGSLLDIIQNPGATNFFYGFDNLYKERVAIMRQSPEHSRTMTCADIAGDLLRLCESVNAVRVWNNEGGETYTPGSFPAEHSANELIESLSHRLGFQVLFPNPFPDEFGLLTKYGIVSHRAVQAVYQAYRVSNYSKSDGKTLEIGAGLGRNAYYARQFGALDYTIVDLPLTNVAQAVFLALVLGEEAVSLGDEVADANQIKIRTPEWLFDSSEKFDLALNVDSMVEIDNSVAEKYCGFISERSKVFLSINHEANQFTIGDISALKSKSPERFPYWMRSGYCEQIYKF